MSNSPKTMLVVAAVLAAGAIAQQQPSSGGLRGKIEFDAASPVALISADWDESSAQPRGGALLLDIHTKLVLRNVSKLRVRGITLVVTAQDLTPGGKGSIALPTLDVAPDENFTARVDLRLLRPMQQGSGPQVRVGIDGVLFDNLSFFGPNQLGSRRSMMIWELEARRDRQYFRSLLEKAGVGGLQREIQASLQRAADRQDVGVRMVRGGRVTNLDTEKPLQFAFLNTSDSPVEPMGGTAQIAGNEARAPQFEIRNRSDKWVRHVEIGWLVQDGDGREFLAGSIPAAPSLAPGQRTQIAQDTLLRFPERVSIRAITGLVNNVEYGDGQIWIPGRSSMNARMVAATPPSPEEQRLLQMYRNKGIQAVIDDLKRAR